MFCSNCGKELVSDMKFCPSCGAPQKLADSTPNAAQASAVVPADPTETKKKGFWGWMKDGISEDLDKDYEKQKSEKDRLVALDSQGIAYCPKCHSTSVGPVKKGFGAGKAVVGTLVAGPIGGLLSGGIGSKKIEMVCMKCGHKFTAGKK